MIQDDPVAHGEPQTGPLRLGGEKGIKDPGEILSFAKTPSGGQVVDLSALIRTQSKLMITLLLHLLRLLPFLCGGHHQLALENLGLRHQLAVYKRTAPQPKLRTTDRLFWVALARVWAGWKQPLIIVTPDTVLRSQRRRFRDHWTKLSGRPTGGRPPVNAELKALVLRMAAANPLWGAPRIHGELLKLGIDVAERTVSRLLPKRRTPPSQTWRTLLANHVRDLVSVDFFTVPSASLRVPFVLVMLAHHRRRVVHFNVTQHPTAHWTAQQIVDAFPNDSAPSFLLRDRDRVYGEHFRYRVKRMRIDDVLTAPHSPWQNPFAERLIGSVRRECLDHIVVLAERVRRMEEAGIITGYRVELGLEKLFPVTAIIRVSAPEENCASLGACVRTLDGVVESHRVTGPARLVLKVVARSVTDLDAILGQLSRYGTSTATIVLNSRSRPVRAR